MTAFVKKKSQVIGFYKRTSESIGLKMREKDEERDGEQRTDDFGNDDTIEYLE